MSRRPRRASCTWVTSLLLALALPAQEPTEPGLTLLEALRSALRLAPSIRQAGERLAQRRGAWDEERGAFDPRLISSLAQRSAHDPSNPAAAALATSSASAELAWRLPTGLQIGPKLGLTRTSGLAGAPATGMASVSLTLVQPLLEGRGRASSAGREQAARLEATAGVARLEHARAEQALSVVRAYWSCRAAYDTLRILTEAETRAARFLDEEQRLVEGKERALGDLHQVRASLDEARANRFEGQQGYERAREELALAMGLDWRAAPALPPPAEPWPTAPAGSLPDPAALVRLALGRRPDLRANDEELQAARLRAQVAQRAQAPRLDLSAELGYAGQARVSGAGWLWRPLAEGVVGPNVQIGLTLDQPWGQRAARGAFARQQAVVRELGLAAADEARHVASDTALTLRLLETALQQRDHARSAAEAYAVAKQNELAKLRSNLSTNFDVLQVDSRLTGAQLALVRAQARVADTLAQLRFATGTLPTGALDDEAARRFTRWPDPD